MRLLAVDIGNSRVKCALFLGPDLERTFDMATDRSASSASYRHALRTHVGDAIPHRSVISSVVPELSERVAHAVKREFMVLPEFVSPKNLPAPFHAHAFRESLGVDRVAAIVAGYHLYGSAADEHRAVIVVDAGTAVTIDVVESSGRHLGGAIWAGPALVAASLSRGTSLLPEIDLETPETDLGTDTASSLRLGVLHGFQEGVGGLIARFQRRLESPAVTIVTGGFGSWLAERLDSIDAYDPHLVLKGIRIIASNGPLQD